MTPASRGVGAPGAALRGHVTTGDRHYPHAQARAARAQPLLLHSLALFREVFAAVFTHCDIGTVVEIGVESGQVTEMYTGLGARRVYCVDPDPSPALRAALGDNDAVRLIEQPSPAALAGLPAAELYVLDGDHNYATVRAELEWILTRAPDAVIVLHDVLWPCGRRDLYYQPTRLPAEARHPDSADGPTIWHDELTPTGFVGAGAFTTATHAGGEANGVLTAVEDAVAAARDSWSLTVIPAVFGVGVLVRDGNPGAEAIRAALSPYADSSLLAAMENNRLALYTRVLQLQYEAAQHVREADTLAERLHSSRQQLDQLTRQLHKAEQRHASDLAALEEAHQRLAAVSARQGTLRGAAAVIAELAGDAARRRVRENPITRAVRRVLPGRRR